MIRSNTGTQNKEILKKKRRFGEIIFQNFRELDLYDFMFLSCHVRVSEWIHILSIVTRMSRNSLLGAGTKSEV